MLWFGKKKKANTSDFVDTDEDILYSESVNDEITEEEILNALEEDDISDIVQEEETFEAELIEGLQQEAEYIEPVDDEEFEECFEDGSKYGEDTEATGENNFNLTRIITSFDELCEFVIQKPIGCIQYMRKSDFEAFSLRETYFRIAGSWGSVSMAREYSEKDYAKIVLASEVLFNPSNYYILPMLSSEQSELAIKNFCIEYYGFNGKKYAKNPSKFSEFVEENDCLDDWLDYTGSIIRDMLEEYCEKNEINFDNAENSDGESDE